MHVEMDAGTGKLIVAAAARGARAARDRRSRTDAANTREPPNATAGCRRRSRPQPPDLRRARGRRLRGRPRVRRRGRLVSRRHRALRRGRARPRPAQAGRHFDPRGLAQGRPHDAGADPDRARPLERQGPGHRRGRRRLCRQAFPHGGGAGAAARAAAPRGRSRNQRSFASGRCRLDARAGRVTVNGERSS